jgi:hypothetical protein
MLGAMERLDAILTKHGYSMGLVLGATGVLLLGLLTMWRSEGPALPSDRSTAAHAGQTPPARARIQADRARLVKRQRAYIQRLLADARRYDVDLQPKKLFAAFPYFITEGSWALSASRGRLVTAELRLTTEVRKLDTPLGALGRYQAPTIVLTVENRTDDHIAFRVVTRPSGKATCRAMAKIPQTTFVLEPRGALSRTECLAGGRGDLLTVHRLDVLRIPALSYHYLVKLKPTALLLPARTSQGHRPPPNHALCGSVPRQTIKQGVQDGTASWADVMDFYARYSCDRFDFHIGYRRSGPDPAKSPVIEPRP